MADCGSLRFGHAIDMATGESAAEEVVVGSLAGDASIASSRAGSCIRAEQLIELVRRGLRTASGCVRAAMLTDPQVARKIRY